MYWEAFDITLCYRTLYALKNEILQSILPNTWFQILYCYFSCLSLIWGCGGGHYAMPKVTKVKLKTGGPVMISCCLDQSFLLFDAPFSQGGIEYFWKLIPRGIIAWCKTQGENLVCLFIWLYGKVLCFLPR